MKKIAKYLAMATPCPKQNVKRPLSRAALGCTLSLILLFLLSIQTVTLFAQQPQKQTLTPNPTYVLTGQVTGEDKQPLAGATLIEVATKQSTQTDANGQFRLTVPSRTGQLAVRYLGYQPQTLNYSTSQALNISLAEDSNTLRTVEVNAGYYTTTQKLSTGSISSVKAEQIEKQPISNPILALQGRVTGAYVQQNSSTPGGNISILIRGLNGIESSSNPLYILDNVPFNSAPLTNNNSGGTGVYSPGGSNPLSLLSPEDIQSIEILKDADATAIYGSRGANGVVLITTKKGISGKTQLQASVQTGTSSPTRTMAMLGTQDYLNLRQTAISLDNTSIKPADYDLNTWDRQRYTNWQNELFDSRANFSSAKMSLSGGSAQHQFQLSGNYNGQGSILLGDQSYQKTGAHLSSSHTSIDQKLKANFSVLLSSDKINWNSSELTSRAINLQPNAPALFLPNGQLNWENSTWVNPLRANENNYLAKNSSLNANATFSYRPLKDLELSSSLGYSSQSLSDRSLTPVRFYDPAEGRTPATSFSDFNQSKLNSWIVEPKASYQKTLAAHQFQLLLGATIQQQQREQHVLRATGFASDALIENPRAAATTLIRDYSNSLYKYSGVFARFNYTFQQRYILNLTARRDGSSRFAAQRQFANFGAMGLAYLFSEETWIQKQLPQLSHGKLRASYGATGNDQIGDYEFLETYLAAGGYNLVPGLAPSRLYNPDFGWEANRKLELGFELGLWKDRLNLTVNYYRNRSSNQLINYPLSSTTGFTSIRANLNATVQNRGLEIELSGAFIQQKDFSFRSSMNVTLPKNTLVSFPGLAQSSYAARYTIGRSLSVQKLYGLLGVNPITGVYQFIDYNGDGLITALDRQSVRETGQRFYGGLDNHFSYKTFQLSFLFQFVGQQQTNFKGQHASLPGASGNQPLAYQGQYWLKEGDKATYQRPSTGSHGAAVNAQSLYGQSDAIVSDASFVRLKNLSISYTPKKLIPGSQLRFFLQGQNLWTLSNYFGLDPESANSYLPLLSTYTAGLSLNL